jgi:hypothetical protein
VVYKEGYFWNVFLREGSNEQYNPNVGVIHLEDALLFLLCPIMEIRVFRYAQNLSEQGHIR